MTAEAKVALVTGGAVRIGRALALALAGRGMRVVIGYGSSAVDAHQLVEEIQAGGGAAVAIHADLIRVEEVARLADEALAAFGRVDVLVNNASVFPPEAMAATTPELWDETLAVNLRAPFFLTRALASELRVRRGCVVNLADLAGVQPWLGYAAHGIAKAGLLHLTRVAARELAPEVRVNAIAPGTVLPPEELTGDEVDVLATSAPLRRNGNPDDVVRAMLYLLDADFVTGETLVVDGGRLLRA